MKKLINTAGTSILKHFKDFTEKTDSPKNNKQKKERILPLLKKYANSVDTDEKKKVGAEIQSITSLIKELNISKQDKLVFLVSDTEDGKLVGEILESFYRNNDYSSSYHVVEGIQNKDGKQFLKGLKKLVQIMSDEISESQSKQEKVYINATGGFKAQISFAGLIGQAFSIPVYYQFEDFASIIKLPPMPVSTDFELWLSNYQLFYQAAGDENDADFPSADELKKLSHKDQAQLSSLFDEVDDKNEKKLTLNAFGQLYHEGFKNRFDKFKDSFLPPPRNSEVVYTFEDKNENKHDGLKDYWERMTREFKYITRLNTFYYNPDLNKNNGFRLDSKGERDRVEGIYSSSGKTTKFNIFFANTKNDIKVTQAVLKDLQDRF